MVASSKGSKLSKSGSAGRNVVASDEEYLDLIRKDPSISEKTKAQYILNLGTLVRETDERGIEWILLNAEDTMTAIMNRFRRAMERRQKTNDGSSASTQEQQQPYAGPSPQSVLAYCAAVTALIKRLNEDWRAALGGDAVLRKHWDRCTSELTAKIREKYDSWRASDRQRDNYVPWEGLIARREQLAADPETYGSNAHLLLAFLTYMPPMRTSNYGQLRLYDEGVQRLPRHAKARKEIESQRWNYVQLFKKRGTVTIQDYKTANHYHRLYNSETQSQSVSVTEEQDDQGNGNSSKEQGSKTTKKGQQGDAASDNRAKKMDGVDRLMSLFASPDELAASAGSKKKKKPADAQANTPTGGIKRGVVVDETFAAGPMIIPQGVYDDRAPKRTGELPPQLFELLRESAKMRPRSWVFVNRAGQPFSTNAFLKHVSTLLQKTFDGKAMSVDLVRHAATNWLDKHYRHDPVVLTYFRYWMMHSRDMQGEYVLAHNLNEGKDVHGEGEAESKGGGGGEGEGK